MNEINNSPDCERASDLIAFLYNEANEHERRDFESHLNECRVCRAEVESFGVVRESITTWRDEVLSGFVATPLPNRQQKKSAIAAIRQFFDLSPLWLKGAIGFAVIGLCALATLPLLKTAQTPTQTANANKTPAVYTEQDVARLVQEALVKSQQVERPTEDQDKIDISLPSRPKPRRTNNQMAESKRPLTRAEREQLAVDLRLLTTRDDIELYLLEDRINQQ